MAIDLIIKRKAFPDRDKLELRLKEMGFQHKVDSKPYTAWKIWNSFLVIRTYGNYYTVHTNGDIDHYEVKKCLYQGISYEMNNFDFLGQLLTKKDIQE